MGDVTGASNTPCDDPMMGDATHLIGIKKNFHYTHPTTHTPPHPPLLTSTPPTPPPMQLTTTAPLPT